MNALLLYLNIFAAAAVFIYFFLKSKIFYLRFSFLASTLYLSWLLPKYISAQQAGIPMNDSWNSVFLFSFLSLIALVFGEYIGGRGVRIGSVTRMRQGFWARPLPVVRADSLAVIVLALVSIGIQVMINALPAAQLTARQPSGLVTILRSFAVIRDLSFPLILYVFITNRNALATVLLSLYGLSYVPDLLLRFKREIYFLTPIAFLFAQYRFRHWILSKRMTLIFLPIAFIMLWGVSEFRKVSGYVMDENGNLVRQLPTFSELIDVDWTNVVGDRVSANYNEALNAAETFREIERTGKFTYGGALTNRFVEKWVPGQIVGYDFKNSLKVDQVDVFDILTSPYEWRNGTTSTGFADAYSDLWFFGVIVYFLNGWYIGRLWARGVRGAITATTVYPAVVVMGMLSISHSAYYIAVNLPFVWFVTFTISKLRSVYLVARRSRRWRGVGSVRTQPNMKV